MESESVVLGRARPKFGSTQGPHVSIEPVVAGLCARPSMTLQSGTKFPFVSVHGRAVIVDTRSDGLALIYLPWFEAGCR